MSDCKSCKWYINSKEPTCGFGTYEFTDNGTVSFRLRGSGFVDGCGEYYNREQYFMDLKNPQAYMDSMGYKI